VANSGVGTVDACYFYLFCVLFKFINIWGDNFTRKNILKKLNRLTSESTEHT